MQTSVPVEYDIIAIESFLSIVLFSSHIVLHVNRAEQNMNPSCPPSLQDLCFVRLISDLETFAHESLALLPWRLRQRLLVNLPAVDICKLDNTAVTKGIDVWETVCIQRLSNCLLDTVKQMQSSLSTDINWKEAFFLSLTAAILNNTTDLETNARSGVSRRKALAALFSIPKCLGINCWDAFEHPFIFSGNDRCCTPSRYSWIAADGSLSKTDLQLLQILMDECAFFPSCLYINCRLFCKAEVWLRRSCTFASVFQRFVSSVQSVEIHSEYDEDVDDDPFISTFLFDAILSQVNPDLHSVSISGDTVFIAAVLKEGSSYLAVEHGESAYSLQSCNIPYGGLQSLSISVDGPLEEIFHLQAILEHQVLLKEVCLAFENSYAGDAGFDKFLTSAAELFARPHFCKLQLEVMGIPLLFAEAIVDRFLSAACSHRQSLVLDNLGIVYNHSASITAHKPTFYLKMADSGYEHKKLVLKDLEGEEVESLFQWLMTYPNLCLFHLGVHVAQHLQDVCFMQLFSNNLNAQINEFSLDWQTIPNRPTLRQDFENLFSNPYLSKLKLKRCNIGPGGLLPMLTQGLRKQCASQSIVSLSLASNSLGRCQDLELRDFFDVLFSLPQVENVKLSLKHNELKSRHFELFYHSWRHTDRKKRLQLLIIGGNQLPDPESELMEKLIKVSIHSTRL